ncbi:hypothetical protein [Rhizobium leguminosarum]|uniref:hypothetical protein n=1 Tax=Rhizobium leguminosarum TaxID=384 RepID=UPI001C9827F4|nr:hypothetical protein [Rhizobium leguminosarum]MBY5521235.1 hypothetical protein [Rhizobium leguminosarum]
MRPPAIFGSNGCNGKISKNFGEISQVDNKMKRKSSRSGAKYPKSSIVAPSADLFTRICAVPMNLPNFAKLLVFLNIRVPF